ncbi:hypothetical protein ASF70_12675 [Rhizobium sp. Leaf321]|uniref:hypothetical protein n=1 Tax=Rhizobium sp. Leaf321 TaxID=1736335 RepID=UPI000712CA3A|nr:hypothetical protein [Rhizobium sp. Leaf321]KQQ72382.1 hypothetical protein ASF70_12675 [Rhizobium sp. Leaf321]
MNKKSWWNPLSWAQYALEAVWGVLSGIWTAILGIFGIHPSAPKGQHADIKLDDVDSAASAEADEQALAKLMTAEMTPAEVVLRYAAAGAMDRPTVDLSALSTEEQDWLVSLSDSDLALLAASGKSACERSLEAKMAIPDLTRLRAEKPMEEAPKAYVQQTKEDMIRERYLAAVRGLQTSKNLLAR